MSKKVFDNGLDHSIVGMSGEEKTELRGKFLSAQDQMAKKMASQKQNNAIDVNAPSPSIFKVIWNFILSLFLGVPFKSSANISVGRLRLVKKHLVHMGVDLFDFKSNALRSETALYVKDIYKGVYPVFNAFINPKEGKNEELFTAYFFDDLMDDIGTNLKDDLSVENLNDIFYDDNIRDKREYLKKKQKEFSDNFFGKSAKKLQTSLLALEQLLSVMHYFDFKGFFMLFGTFVNNALSVDYEKIEPEKALDFLRSLGAAAKLVTSAELEEDAFKAFSYANQKMKEHGFEENFIDPVIVNRSLSMLRKLVKLEVIESLIQYITMDETQISGFVKPKRFILNRYIGTIINRSTRDFNRIENEKAKEFLMQSILDFFNVRTVKDLSYAGFYTPESQEYFENNDIKSMEYVKALAIMLTFLKIYYEGFLREVINTIVVKGNFVKKSDSENFSALYYSLDDVIEKLRDFIAQELEPSEKGNNIILELLHNKKDLTPVEKKTIKNKLKKNDMAISEYLEKIVETYYKIMVSLKKVGADFKKRYPEFLANFQQLSGIKGRSFSSSVEESLRILDTFFDIMRNFMVIKADPSNFM